MSSTNNCSFYVVANSFNDFFLSSQINKDIILLLNSDNSNLCVLCFTLFEKLSIFLSALFIAILPCSVLSGAIYMVTLVPLSPKAIWLTRCSPLIAKTWPIFEGTVENPVSSILQLNEG